MYSCYTPTITYGFYDDAYDGYIISKDYLREEFPMISLYATDVIRNYGTNYAVGIHTFLSKDGKLTYDEETYDDLMKFKSLYEKHHGCVVELQYIIVIYGDYEDNEYMTYELSDLDDSIVEDLVSRPSTPTNQPTKPASTNAPHRPIKCRGCVEQQPNQMAHVGEGGCLAADGDGE